jgi:rod shape determining protein RodA
MIIGLTLLLYIVFTPEIHDLLIKYTPLEPHQLSRITVWLKPFESSEGDGLQLSQSLILVGSAGILGHGPGFGGIPLPEPHSDVIFSQATGMFGIFMGIFLVALYTFLTNQIINVAKRSENLMYTFICIGYSSLFAVQSFENIGMMIGVFPITGIVLPFMSYGVSALLSYFAIMGVVSKIDSERKLNPELFDLKKRQ